MQNASLPVPRQSDLFDEEPAISPSRFRFPVSPEEGRSVSKTACGGGAAEEIKTRVKMALLLSLLLHAALASLFCVRSGQMLSPELDRPLQATWITWADAVSPIEKIQAPVPAAAVFPSRVSDQQIESASAKTAMKISTVLPTGLNGAKDEAPEIKPAAIDRTRAEALAAVSPSASVNEKDLAAIPDRRQPAAETKALSTYTTMAKPRYRENASPVYPPEARLRGQQGIVVVHAEILPEGRAGVLKVKTSSGYTLLDQSALDAVRTWRFEPARKMGMPVAVLVEVPIRFVLKPDR